MAYISDSGTGFAGRIWGLAGFSAAALVIAAPVAHAASGASVSLTLTGLRNHKGQVLVCVTANAKAFPDCRKDKHAARLVLTTKDVAGDVIRVPLSGAGTYAISAIHDENGNGKLDTTVMLPNEGFGFSRNPAIRFGPPKFKKAAFTVGDEAVAQTVKIKYML